MRRWLAALADRRCPLPSGDWHSRAQQHRADALPHPDHAAHPDHNHSGHSDHPLPPPQLFLTSSPVLAPCIITIGPADYLLHRCRRRAPILKGPRSPPVSLRAAHLPASRPVLSHVAHAPLTHSLTHPSTHHSLPVSRFSPSWNAPSRRLSLCLTHRPSGPLALSPSRLSPLETRPSARLAALCLLRLRVTTSRCSCMPRDILHSCPPELPCAPFISTTAD